MGRPLLRYLLDSHAWLWLAGGVELQGRAIDLFTTAAANGQLFLSPMSVWEIARKAQDGGIAVDGDVLPWIHRMVRTTDVQIADFTFDVALDTSQLPGQFHKDPVDRAIASTCRVHDLTLLTRDHMLLALSALSSYHAIQV